MKTLSTQKSLWLYLVKFFGAFFLLFYGTEAVIAFSSPGRFYLPFVEAHLNFIDPFRQFLLGATQNLLSLFGFQAVQKDMYTLGFTGGSNIVLVYSCIGYGVISFWVAFVFANKGSWSKKAVWMVAGCACLCAINIFRISALLVAVNKKWAIPLGWDHHTWFNIVAYGLIFCLMYLYDRSAKRGPAVKPEKSMLITPKAMA
jgi:exosortase/archaeosortase family protein